MSDGGFIAEAVIQFSRSPLWRGPVNDFLDDNCYIFDTEDEMKLEYTSVHNQFRQLVDGLLTDFVTELGVSLDDTVKALMAASQQKGREAIAAQNFLKTIFAVDDFALFHRMMVKRNIELDILATAALENRANPNPRNQLAVQTNGDIDEDEAFRLAIQASLQDSESSSQAAQQQLALQDAELREALAASVQAENERARLQKAEVDKQLQQVQGHDLQVASQIREQQFTAIEVQKEQNIKNMSERTLAAREDNVRKNITAQLHATPTSKCASPSPDSTPAPPVVAPPATMTPAPAAQPVLAPPPPVATKLAFGFAPLPSIKQPSLQTLKTQVQTQQPAPVSAPAPTPAAAVPQAAPPSKEELEARAKYMREQRERILAANKANRKQEIDEYARKNNMPVPAGRQGGQADSSERQLTVDIARRLREDILGEARK